MALTGRYPEDIQRLDELLRVTQSFDLVKRQLTICGKAAAFYFIDGFVKDDIMEKIMEFLLKLTPQSSDNCPTMETFASSYLPYVEVDCQQEEDQIASGVLSGAVALVMEGYPHAAMIDARTYPTRGVEEPEDDRVLRGSRDGFVETLVFNTALIRRRIRDPQLTMEIHTVGGRSKTDVVLCYLQDKANPELVQSLRRRLAQVEVEALNMGQESLTEALVRQRWWNPFPKVRYTERPDSAAASVLEGKILLLTDNSPSALLLPTSLFDFVQEADDYYFPPVTGTYLRLTRIVIFLLTLFLTPVWYLLIHTPSLLPEPLAFLLPQDPGPVPIFLQLLLIELAIDGLKLASLNTPGMLSNSFSVVGALILGDFAVRARWFAPEVILYMAFVAIANFTQPSYELGYAFKFMRILLLCCTAAGGLWGFAAGLVLILLFLCCNKTVSGKSYLYPLIPFHPKEFFALFYRRRIRRYEK